MIHKAIFEQFVPIMLRFKEIVWNRQDHETNRNKSLKVNVVVNLMLKGS